MKSSRFKLPATLALFLVAAPFLVNSSFGQSLSVGGLYQIISGHYAEYVEAFGGGPPKLPLPTQAQSYVELAIDEQSQIARMAILGSDMQTIFSSGDFGLSLTKGAIFPDYIEFDNRSGNQETTVSDQYTISNSTGILRIDGATVGSGTRAVPFLWEYSNVVATLVAPSSQPLLSLPRAATNGLIQFRMFNGLAGETNILEASTDLMTWIPISTNVFPATVGATSPFIDLTESPNLTRRFYRSVRLP
jgi:hypothetical protein